MDLSEFITALLRSIVEGIRRNRLPVCLSLVALVLKTAFALTSNFDERPRYRRFVLPEIEKTENQFFDQMREAEYETEEPARALYFLEGHRRAKNVIHVLESEHPMTE